MPIPVAFYESAAFNGLNIINTVEDPVVNREGAHHLKLGGRSIAGIVARGANLAELQLNGAKALPICETTEVQALAADITGEDVVPLHYDVPAKELISCDVDNSNNNEATAVVLLLDGKFWVGAPPNQKFTVIQVSSTTAGVAGTWTTMSMSYPSDLPADGVAKVLGARCKSASSYAVRAVATPRWGVPTQHATQGPFFWFANPYDLDLGNRPSFEILSSTTTAVHNLELAVQLPPVG